MKFLDRFIRNRRIAQVIRVIPRNVRVFDIGCHDGHLFDLLGSSLEKGIGIDPFLTNEVTKPAFRLLPGSFPDDVPGDVGEFDIVCALAVLEHVRADELSSFVNRMASLLAGGGAVVLTVPSPRVDAILDLLIKLRLLDGMEPDQHHGFQIGDIVPLFVAAGLSLERHTHFQFGLNNLFLFRKPVVTNSTSSPKST